MCLDGALGWPSMASLSLLKSSLLWLLCTLPASCHPRKLILTAAEPANLPSLTVPPLAHCKETSQSLSPGEPDTLRVSTAFPVAAPSPSLTMASPELHSHLCSHPATEKELPPLPAAWKGWRNSNGQGKMDNRLQGSQMAFLGRGCPTLENIPLGLAARAALQCPLLWQEGKGALLVNGFSLATNKVGVLSSHKHLKRTVSITHTSGYSPSIQLLVHGEADQHLQFLSISTALRSKKSILEPRPTKVLVGGCLSVPDQR